MYVSANKTLRRKFKLIIWWSNGVYIWIFIVRSNSNWSNPYLKWNKYMMNEKPTCPQWLVRLHAESHSGFEPWADHILCDKTSVLGWGITRYSKASIIRSHSGLKNIGVKTAVALLSFNIYYIRYFMKRVDEGVMKRAVGDLWTLASMSFIKSSN